MKKVISLVVGIVALSLVIYNVAKNPELAHILGLEVNVWVYRSFWAVVSFASFYDFFTGRKHQK